MLPDRAFSSAQSIIAGGAVRLPRDGPPCGTLATHQRRNDLVHVRDVFDVDCNELHGMLSYSAFRVLKNLIAGALSTSRATGHDPTRPPTRLTAHDVIAVRDVWHVDCSRAAS